MNIAIVTTWFERGAGYVSRAYRDILSLDNEIFIYARAGEKYAQGNPKWDGPNVTWGKRIANKVDTWIDADDFWQFIEQNSIECLIFNEQQSWDILVEIKRRRPNLPIGAYVDYYTPDTVPFFAAYDFLLCNTKRHYSVFNWHPNALYLPWGTDLKLFRPRARARAREAQNGLVFFHSCGMDARRKGTASIVQAWTQLQGESNLFIHSQLPLSAEIIKIAQRYPQRITIQIGDVTAPGLYHEGDVYVYPSILEGIGLTIAEALACGLPVIATDNGPMNEWIHEGQSGRLVSVEKLEKRWDNYYWPESYPQMDSLQQAMQYYVDLPSIEPEKAKARDYAEQHLNWQNNASDLSRYVGRWRDKGESINENLAERILRSERKRQLTTAKSCKLKARLLLSKLGIGKVKRKLVSLLRR